MIKYISEINPEEFNQGSSVTIGSFDGVHIAHRSLLKQLVDGAKAQGHKSVIITFETHPRIIMEGENCSMRLLSTTNEKAKLLESLGVDVVLLVKFEEIRPLTARQFYETILIEHLNTQSIIVGYNNNIGSDRVNAYNFFKSMECVDVIKIGEIDNCGDKINSTRVRELLKIGDIERANELLGECYSVEFCLNKESNIVVKTDKNKLLPTPNIYHAKINNKDIIIKVDSDNSIIINKIDLLDIEYNTNFRVQFIKK